MSVVEDYRVVDSDGDCDSGYDYDFEISSSLVTAVLGLDFEV